MRDKFKTREYYSWSSMKQRCLNPKNHAWERYGGRGIKVCDRWLKFSNFLDDIGEIPDGHTIDRIDNDGDYTPENVKMSTTAEQNINRSNALIVEFDGLSKTLKSWSEHTGIPYATLHYRMHVAKWPVEKALTTPVRKTSRVLEMNGESHSVSEWSKITGINATTITARLNRFGWSVEKALTTY
jgi:hypothetical protein